MGLVGLWGVTCEGDQNQTKSLRVADLRAASKHESKKRSDCQSLGSSSSVHPFTSSEPMGILKYCCCDHQPPAFPLVSCHTHTLLIKRNQWIPHRGLSPTPGLRMSPCPRTLLEASPLFRKSHLEPSTSDFQANGRTLFNYVQML